MKNGCKKLNEFCQLDNVAWMAEISKGIFNKLDTIYMVATDEADIGIELSNTLDRNDEVENGKLEQLLASLPYAFCKLAGIGGGDWDHDGWIGH
jgi:hypothetical protein